MTKLNIIYMHLKHVLLLLLVGIPFLNGLGQENIALHTDKPFYVAGERIWFSAYVKGEGGLSIPEGNLLISLYDESGEKVQGSLFPIEKGKAVGDMFLEEALEPGNYLLRLVTPDVKPEEIYVLDAILPILHPSQLQKIQISEATMEPSFVGEIPPSNLTAEINKSRESLTTRESLDVNLKIPGGENARASVGVRHLSQVGIDKLQWLPASYQQQPKDNKAAADSWNLSIDISQKAGGIIPATVNVYWVEQDTQILAKVSEGNIRLSLPKKRGLQHFQLLDASPFPNHDFQAEWSQLGDLDIPLPKIPTMGELADVQRNYLYWSQRRKLVERLFQISTSEALEREGEPLRTKPDKSYASQKYLAFKDLEAFIIEVLAPAVKVVKGKEGKSVRMLNFDSRVRFTQPPLIFLDNYLIKDVSQIWEINWNNVDYIEIFGSHETMFPLFGPMGQGRGVIRIFTKGRQDFTGKIELLPSYELDGYANKNQFLLPDTDQETPDLRPILFWDGDLQLDGEGELNIAIPQSDLKGDFMIEIRGLTSDNKIFESYHIYSVK